MFSVYVPDDPRLGSIELNTYLIASDHLRQENQDSWNHLGVVLHRSFLLQCPLHRTASLFWPRVMTFCPLFSLLFSLFTPFPCLPPLLNVPHTLIQHTWVFSSPISLKSQANVAIRLALFPWSRVIDLPVSRSIHYVSVDEKSHPNGRTWQEASTQISSSWSNHNQQPALLSAQVVSRGKSWESFLFFRMAFRLLYS